MKRTETRDVARIGELCRGDVVRHKATGQTYLVDACYDKFAIGVTHQHISNPAEWEIVVVGVQHKEQVESSDLLPDGWYVLEIWYAEVRTSMVHYPEPRHNRLVLKCRIVGAESPWMRDVLIGKPVTHSFAILPEARAPIYKFLTSMGFDLERSTSVEGAVIELAKKIPGMKFEAYIYVVGQYNALRDERAVGSAETGPFR